VRVSTSGGGMTALTDAKSINVTPSFSPDGSKIVFNSDRDGTQQLYVMGANGAGVQRLSFGPGQYGEPAWSPRGDLIAYTNWDTSNFSIGLMSPDGSAGRMVTQGFIVESPTFCPNGRVIMFDRQTPSPYGHESRLMRVAVDGFNEQFVGTPANATHPSWSASLS